MTDFLTAAAATAPIWLTVLTVAFAAAHAADRIERAADDRAGRAIVERRAEAAERGRTT